MYAVSAEVKGLDMVVSLLSDAVLQPRLLGTSTLNTHTGVTLFSLSMFTLVFTSFN